MTSYVLGFALHGQHIVLIRKTRPEWQAGHLNGVGGKIESGESPIDAMVREFREETGLNTPASSWHPFTTMRFDDAEVRCFATRLRSGDVVTTTTDEEVVLVDVRRFGEHDILPNLYWLVPMALYELTREYEDNSLPHTLDYR